MENQAAWFLANREARTIDPAEIPHPSKGKIVIEVD
jgi:hypothetical protein